MKFCINIHSTQYTNHLIIFFNYKTKRKLLKKLKSDITQVELRWFMIFYTSLWRKLLSLDLINSRNLIVANFRLQNFSLSIGRLELVINKFNPLWLKVDLSFCEHQHISDFFLIKKKMVKNIIGRRSKQNVDFILFQPLFLERKVKNHDGPYPLNSRPQASLAI